VIWSARPGSRPAAIYSGDDALTLALLGVGGVGVVGTSTHFSGVGTKKMLESFFAGQHREALKWHHTLLPIFTGVFKTQGAILVKAGLNHIGLPAGPMRLPLIDATEAELATFIADAGLAGIRLEAAGAAR
jgi:4-hydroxy-tetrahydrodipicolinate synthase